MSNSLFREIVRAINGNGLVRSAKNLRNEMMDQAFRLAGHAERDRFLAAFKADGRPVVFAVAFNTPWVVDLLTASWAENVADSVLVVVDNSKSRAARQVHREICRARGVPYAELPKNREWHPNRSHAIAMNWIYYHLVDALKPEMFGFIDHDCFPIRPVSIAERLEGRSGYGLISHATREPAIWYFWAGFGFFRYAITSGRAVDFKHAYEWGADTGARNWRPIFSTLQESYLREAKDEMVPAGDGAPVSRMQIIDERFNHIGKASYTADLAKPEQRKALADFLWAQYLPGKRPLVTP
ncbi:MAG: hypothetical protein M9939_17355 [Mesorhizobium sp.]|nr:hypothetical protein [Mesorhizobium sp.]MCO5162905.1 hypothetical protein [Mesorhizobium sp.]